MTSLTSLTMFVSGTAVPLLSFVFFRWIPGHQLPPLIYTATALQALSLVASRSESFSQAARKIVPRSSIILPLCLLAINAIQALMVADVVYRPLFVDSNGLTMSRVGFVSYDSAEILVREPDSSELPLSVSCRIVGHATSKQATAMTNLSGETDFTQVFHIDGLESSTHYEYTVSNNKTGSFKTAPLPGESDPRKPTFTFLTSSCIKARFPYNPSSHPLAVPGLQKLAEWIPILGAQFLLFLGDFIYVDVPHRHGFDVDNYRREYRQVYSSPDWPAVSSDLPWIHVIDDHEIANDWDRGLDAPYSAAIDPWEIYHASVNPPSARPNASYFQFTQGPASFFMLDTRRYRSPEFSEPATSSNKTMLGEEQLSSLLTFLSRSEPRGVRWKFVISSIPFTRNWRVNSADTWAGYLHERRIVLEAMWDVGLHGDGIGVVVLSGDRHEFAATALPPPKDGRWPRSCAVHEFSTSPLSMFYLPFRTYWEVKGEAEEEVCIKYIPDGNSKFGAIELEKSRGNEGLLRFRLFVDGKESWQHMIKTPPMIPEKSSLELEIEEK